MTAYYEIPLGLLEIVFSDAIHGMKLVDRPGNPHTPAPLSDRAIRELNEYLDGKRRTFDLPLAPEGTAFQQQVWNALRDIPWGETRSYGQIAAAIGKPGASRAVGLACKRNPIWILIPCHRVLGSKNALTGYAGGLKMKKLLLELEHMK